MKKIMPYHAVILPAFKPSEILPELVNDLRAALDILIVVVNDGSPETCEHIFTQLRAVNVVVLEHSRNCGKGRALKSAFEYILQNHPQISGAVTADADGQHRVADIIKCIETLDRCPDNLIIGSRDLTAPQVPWKSRFGNRVCSWLFKLRYDIRLNDTQCGLRGIPAEFMQILLDVSGERYEFESSMLKAARNSAHRVFPFREIPIEAVYEPGNPTSHLKIFQDSQKILAAILKNE